MTALDAINDRWGARTLDYAMCGLTKTRKTECRRRSPAYTTDWSALPVMNASCKERRNGYDRRKTRPEDSPTFRVRYCGWAAISLCPCTGAKRTKENFYPPSGGTWDWGAFAVVIREKNYFQEEIHSDNFKMVKLNLGYLARRPKHPRWPCEPFQSQPDLPQRKRS